MQAPQRALAIVVLAAGAGTRMNSELPKPLQRLAQAPLLAHCIRAAQQLEPEHLIVVTGYKADLVETELLTIAPEAVTARQNEQLGTGHAVLQASDALRGFEGDLMVLYGDSPFFRVETLERMRQARDHNDLVMLGFEPEDPARYGRMVMDGDRLLRIVEFKDATDEERQIELCNSGVLCGDAARVLDLLTRVTNDNAAGEYYLTDLPALAHDEGFRATAITCPEDETLGIDSRLQLAKAEREYQSRKRQELLEIGVTMPAPETVYLSFDTHVGRDALVEPYVVFGPRVTVESNATIRAFSHLEDCHVSAGAVVGPYARLRPGTMIGHDARIGNFVEVKQAEIHNGAKVNHLSYVGDASIGEAANIGAGTVTCNYDGVTKHRTEVGRSAFIGSNTMLVAPVKVGASAMTASGSVITEDVPADSLALGRARQVNKLGLAAKLMARLRAQKIKNKGN